MRIPATTVLSLSVLYCASVCHGQQVVDPSLMVRTWLDGVPQVSGLAFLPGGSDALVLQRHTGKVFYVHGQQIGGTALDLKVANAGAQGLLGIALHPDFGSNGFVYLYYTAASKDGGKATANRIERYRWNGSDLLFDRRIQDLPALNGTQNVGGRISFGQDGKLYGVIGDLDLRQRTQNRLDSKTTSLSSVVVRLNDDGSVPADNPFATTDKGRSAAAMRRIYAYGVRDSRGLAFDPLTGRLWATETGPGRYDEINLIRPGFNSGWEKLMGPKSRNGFEGGPLVMLGSAARYADPKFSWRTSIVPTDLTFFTGGGLGAEYYGDLFVASAAGNIYRFELNDARNDLVLAGALADRVADNQSAPLSSQQSSIIFGTDFGPAVQIIEGPGGLYVVDPKGGKIHEITPIPEPAAAMLAVCGAAVFLGSRRRGIRRP